MSNIMEEQINNNTKPKIMTGYIHYNESDDLTQLFQILNEFRKNNGLKYSHQGKVSMVFFNISSEHLDALYKMRPFKISKFQTKSEYQCDSDTANKLMEQKDSFVRMTWNEQTNVLTLMSRTIGRVHGNLVRRIFKDSGLEFNNDHYKVLRDYLQKTNNEDNGHDNGHDHEHTHTHDNCTHEHVQKNTNPEGFQRVSRTKKNTEYKKTVLVNPTNSTKSKPKMIKETTDSTKPKIRGTKVPKNNL